MSDWIAALGEHEAARDSAPERIARLLRARVTDGSVRPGERLPEDRLTRALRVSRNTLREAFRMLSHERLLVHELNRGVFVRRPSAEDVRDIYRLRRVIELPAVRGTGGLDAMGAAVERARERAASGDWAGVASANIDFHRALVARLAAELRLAFHGIATPEDFHAPYLARNERLLELLSTGDLDAAARELADYLDEALERLASVHG
ncbi:GntR family transcriptional regulator [Actinorhabdospora filicis]|uniref:GntR family transcriptional regulator n=1 Tax=Actinorhabdospora filicis TaxID=1785913 RepID=A0A9W6WD34_9ACTN|nr:GntR family transcriptional regulator [Actinorhabdospora filicis]GLZ80420.1 GntR family transcriptional regulator [Actinorhabdospora filicis]